MKSHNYEMTLIALDPPPSQPLLEYHKVSPALLYFTVVATTLFLLFALILLMSNTVLRKRK